MRRAANRHPPLDRRCQIYVSNGGELSRCHNAGTHWEEWGNCDIACGSDECEADFLSWECDGNHDAVEAVAC